MLQDTVPAIMAWIYSFAIIGSEIDNEWPGILNGCVCTFQNQPILPPSLLPLI